MMIAPMLTIRKRTLLLILIKEMIQVLQNKMIKALWNQKKIWTIQTI
jgi:hypothetical protein